MAVRRGSGQTIRARLSLPECRTSGAANILPKFPWDQRVDNGSYLVPSRDNAVNAMPLPWNSPVIEVRGLLVSSEGCCCLGPCWQVHLMRFDKEGHF